MGAAMTAFAEDSSVPKTQPIQDRPFVANLVFREAPIFSDYWFGVGIATAEGVHETNPVGRFDQRGIGKLG